MNLIGSQPKFIAEIRQVGSFTEGVGCIESFPSN